MELTRRDALRGAGVLTVGGLAGCLGGGSGGETVDSLPAPTKGPSDAPITVQAFEDFSCSHCRNFALDVLPRLESEYIQSGDVRYEHHDFPFVEPEWSWKVASGARAVQDEYGNEMFFEFAHGIYQNFGNYSLDLIGTVAEQVGADPDLVKSAASELTYKPVLESDKSLGEQQGVTGTPMVFVNGTMAEDYSFSTVSAAIDAEL